MSRARSLVAALIGLLILGACGNAGPGSQKAQTPVRGGTMTVALWQEPNTLYPYYATQTVSNLVYEVALEGLVRTDPAGNYVPLLAKEVPTLKNGGVKVSSDGKKMDVTYHLLPNVKWADGQPFTSADVQFTWQAIMRDPKVTTREGYDQIESIDASDPLTAVVHYKTIYAAYATRFASYSYPILPKHILENVPDISKSDFVRTPIGTGAFKITEFQSADHITAERNPNYRVRGKPHLDRIIFRSVPSREVAIAQLKAGEVDAVWNVLEAQLPDLEKQPDIKIQADPGPSVERIEFNLAKAANPADPKVPHPVLGDVNVRHALVLATPKKQIIDKLLFGRAVVGSSPVSMGWASPKDLKQEGYDPARAKQILDRAGWKAGSDGVRVKDGVRAELKLTTTSGDQIREEIEQILVDQWSRIGIHVSVNNVPSAVLFGSWSQNSPRKKGDYDMNMYASSPDIDPQGALSTRYTCAAIPTIANGGAGFGYQRYCDATVDRLLQQAGSTVDQAKRRPLFGEVLKRLNDAYLSVWLYNRSGIDAYRATVGGYRGNAWDQLTWNTEDWFVKR